MRRTLALTLGALTGFAALAARVSGDEVPWLDTRVLRLVPANNEPNSLSRVCEAFVAAGMVFGATFVAVAFLWLIWGRNWRLAIFWFSAFAGVAALDVALKPIFERPPIGDSSDGYSFPSGNAMGSLALLVAATILLPGGVARRRLLIVGAGLVIAYGAALVYISWHYPTDVLGGWLLSLGWVCSVALVVRPPDALEPWRPTSAPRLSRPRLSRD